MTRKIIVATKAHEMTRKEVDFFHL